MKKFTALLALLGLLACVLCAAGPEAAGSANPMVGAWDLTVDMMEIGGGTAQEKGTMEVFGSSGSLFYGTMTINQVSGKEIMQFTGNIWPNGSFTMTVPGTASLEVPSGSTGTVQGKCTVNVKGTDYQGTTSTSLRSFVNSALQVPNLSVCNGALLSSKTSFSCAVNSSDGGTYLVTGTRAK